MIRPKYQLTTDASETLQNVGPDVAAERERSKGIVLRVESAVLKWHASEVVDR